MAESFLFTIATKVLTKIGSLACDEVCLWWGLESDLRKLGQTLSTIKAVLLDAEERQTQNPELHVWLGNLKDVLYDAEDVLEEFECEALRRKVVMERGTVKRKVCRFLSSSNPVIFRFEIGHKINKIRNKLDKIADDKSKFHLTERYDVRRVFVREMTHSYVRSSDVIGRESDTENIINFLMQPAEKISLIPIVGIGGLGKTTLAKMVYNDKRVKDHFHLRMWVCVSEDFDVTRLIKDIISSATGKNCDMLTIDQAQSHLREILDGRKFLLILDDVWSDDPVRWNELRQLLMDCADGSKILVTTRSNQVATIMTTSVPAYVLKGLSDEDCLLLFLKWAFRKGEEKKYKKLVEIGKEIITKCGGVPLAVRTLGSLLYTKTDVKEWLFIRDNDIWRLEQRENDILPALKLSYDHLPSHLQQCFAYCSIFPKDYSFDSEYLIYYWMAVGVLTADQNENEELEDVGLRYLKELMSRCFFQDVEDHGYFYTFKMHDLMNDLALSVTRRECSMVSFRTQNVDEKVRHFTFIDSNFVCLQLPKFLSNVKCIRTIFFPGKRIKNYGESFLKTFILNFKYLRLLYLESVVFQSLPDSIGTLKHLKLLYLSGNYMLEKVPESICKLQSLQTLGLLRCSSLKKLPNNMRNMINLRYLEITTKDWSIPENGIGCLSSLRYLCMYDCTRLLLLFQGMENLTALRTFQIGLCPHLVSFPRSMQYLTKLEKLVIWGCDKLNLKMEWQGEDVRLNLRIFIINGLPALTDLPQLILQGSANTLQEIQIKNCPKLTTLPEWLPNLTSLEKLEIVSCPGLSNLPTRMSSLTALTKLKIQDSPALIETCRLDAQKIVHVKEVQLID